MVTSPRLESSNRRQGISGGQMTARLNSRHVSQSERTEAVAEKLRGDAIRSAPLSALTPLRAPRVSPRSHVPSKENTDVSVTSPRRAGERSLDMKIWGSKSSGQPCTSDKNKIMKGTGGGHGKAEGQTRAEGGNAGQCDSQGWRTQKEETEREREQSSSARSLPLSLVASYVDN